MDRKIKFTNYIKKLYPSHITNFQKGYTLFEIMLVLGIIAVLVGSAIYLLVGNVDIAKEQRVESDIQAIATQLKTYEMLNFTYPTTAQGLKALVEKPTIEPIPRRWRKLMDSVPLDPWGTPYQYAYPGKRNPEKYDLYSLGPDRKESDDDLPKKN
ncbi:MAG: type II secretion system major pseudopilin GspG [Chthoniobacterales bacterium]|nr:type II secretion system major pseudopilin GspG [Chthoniobacterales bacterium]